MQKHVWVFIQLLPEETKGCYCLRWLPGYVPQYNSFNTSTLLVAKCDSFTNLHCDVLQLKHTDVQPLSIYDCRLVVEMEYLLGISSNCCNLPDSNEAFVKTLLELQAYVNEIDCNIR